MKNIFDYLLWLGAGSATEPTGLLDQAKNALLIDAREVASQQLSNLKSQYPKTQIKIETTVISSDGKDANFTEYNLPEYSAINAATGIKSLLPGLKSYSQEKRQTRPLADIVSNLNLKNDNNLLVLNIPDLDLSLLETLTQSNLPARFSKLYIQTSKDSLYSGSATQEQVITWLQNQGYSFNEMANSDPDMPWITATINPLWQQLQAVKRESTILNQELVDARKQLKIHEEKLTHLQTEQQHLLDKNKIDLDEIRTLRAQQDEKEKTIAEQEKLISGLSAQNEESKGHIKKISDLQEIEREKSAHLETIKNQLDEKVKKTNDQEKLFVELKKENEDLKKSITKAAEKEKDLNNKLNEQSFRNNNMEHEVIKLEAQLELITNVLLREKAL